MSSVRLLADLKLLCDKERASLVAAYLPNKTFLGAKQDLWVLVMWVLEACRCEQLGAAVGTCRSSLNWMCAGMGLESGQE